MYLISNNEIIIMRTNNFYSVASHITGTLSFYYVKDFSSERAGGDIVR